MSENSPQEMYLRPYESSNDDEDADDSNDKQEKAEIQRKKRRREPKRQREWNLVRTFDKQQDAIDYVKSLKCWRRAYKNHTYDGNKEYYRCGNRKKRDKQCTASIYLLYHSTSLSVSLYETTDDHSCSPTSPSSSYTQRQLSPEMKAEIETLYKVNDYKAKKIFEILQNNGHTPRNVTQIQNYLHQIKKKELEASYIARYNDYCHQN